MAQETILPSIQGHWRLQDPVPGAQDSTSTRCALGTSSRVLRMLTESGDVIRYVFLLSAGLRPFILDVGGSGEPVVSSWDFMGF